MRRQVGGQRLRLTDDDPEETCRASLPTGSSGAGGSRRSSHPTRFCDGIGTSSPQKWTCSRRRPGRPSVLPEIGRLVVRMATENPRWGYTRLRGPLKNLHHRVARSTIATILRAYGIPAERRAADLVAGIPAGALGRGTGRGLLRDKGLDRPRPGCLLHAVCDRTALASRLARRLDAAPRRGLCTSGCLSAERCGRGGARRI